MATQKRSNAASAARDSDVLLLLTAPEAVCKVKRTASAKEAADRVMGQSLRAAIAASLKEARAPRFTVGALVYVTFADGLLYPGMVAGIDGPHNTPRYTVDFDDGSREAGVTDDEIRVVDEPISSEEAPDAAIGPTLDQLRALPPLQPLPAENIPRKYHPGGSHHCGGDLCFPNMTLCNDQRQYRMPK